MKLIITLIALTWSFQSFANPADGWDDVMHTINEMAKNSNAQPYTNEIKQPMEENGWSKFWFNLAEVVTFESPFPCSYAPNTGEDHCKLVDGIVAKHFVLANEYGAGIEKVLVFKMPNQKAQILAQTKSYGTCQVDISQVFREDKLEFHCAGEVVGQTAATFVLERNSNGYITAYLVTKGS